MASESAATSINGVHGSHVPLDISEPQALAQAAPVMNGVSGSGNSASSNSLASLPTTVTQSSGPDSSNNSASKDEVSWYFVEQYYTTLSKNPEKLHLFYTKLSQYVSGVEAEKVSVSVGQRAIHDRIKELDIQDCKVLVTNVDSQESFNNIVVQVIGEMSNRAAPPRKFVQTFILAEQPNGYFVLNDIFRYINDEDEEEMEQETPMVNDSAAPSSAEAPPPKALDSSGDFIEKEREIERLDEKLEKKQVDDRIGNVANGPINEISMANGLSTIEADEDEVPQDVPTAASSRIEVDPNANSKLAESVTAAEATKLEKPRDPDTTPVASPPEPAKAVSADTLVPTAPSKPAAPKTWANLVAANRVQQPAIPGPGSSTSPVSSQQKGAPSSVKQIDTAPSSAGENVPSQSSQGQGAEWQTAGPENGKRHGRQPSTSISGIGDKENVLGYVKNVTDKVDASILKNTLLQYGKLAYFDVSRQKNCAFVEFADTAGYNAAVGANPHNIGGEQIYVEERRPRPNAYGGGYNQNRGGMRSGRGNTEGRLGNQGQAQGRGGFQKEGGRGGFNSRGRGSNMSSRGRGQPQAV